MTASGFPPVGYSLVLPPGWLRVPIRHGDPDAEVAALLDEAFAGRPRDSSGPLRHEIERRVRALVDRARGVDALDVYAPLLGVRGRAVPASLVVTDVVLAAPGGPDGGPDGGGHAPVTAGVLAALVADAGPDGTLVTLPAGAAARVVRRLPADEESAGLEMLRIDHHLPVPDGDGRWIVTSAVLPAGLEPLTSVLVDLVDALMTTWRWRDAAVTL